ncbi:MAG: DUF5659 domain-containing protein [Patescibacteria group bacterium]
MTTETQNEKDFTKTADLSLAAAIYLFYPLESIEKQNPRKATFFFKRDSSLDELVESYWRGELKVDPQEYFNALRIIKTRLYSDR